MSESLSGRAEDHAFQELFLHDLHWSAPDLPPITFSTDAGEALTITNVSSYKGLRVWTCNQLPGSMIETLIDREVAKTTTDRLLIFFNDEAQVWRWPVRRNKDNSVTTRLARHLHRHGRSDARLSRRLEAIQLPVDGGLNANDVLSRVRAAFDVETQNETKHASKLMARLFTAMEKAYASDYPVVDREHEISVSLARILFLMFGDDTDMWHVDSFGSFVRHGTDPDGSDIHTKLLLLFDHLNSSSGAIEDVAAFGLDSFPYVNGGIFEERFGLPTLNQEFRKAVLDACAVNWSTISPAIFGSIFQSVRDAKTRRELGEHYTSEENILKTLLPLFLDELRAEFERARTMKGEKQVLQRLWKRLGSIRFLDPACGCGNFIIVAYRELRDIELRIMERLQEISGRNQLSFDPTLSLRVSLDNFYGIEIDEWPARIAETAMFLIDRQCDLKLKECFGEAPQRLPIEQQAKIVAGESALEIDWADLIEPTDSLVVAGNPPFLGISLRSSAQTEELKAVWGDRYHGTLDYVTGWHAKAMEHFKGIDGRWAFVTTNSITQGEAVAPLFEPLLDDGWRIKFAHRTFKWTSEASGQAAVHCVVIGFDRGGPDPRLFDYETPESTPVEVAQVSNITPYLTDGLTVLVHPTSRPLNPQLGEVSYGNKPTDGGGLVVEVEDYAEIMSDPIAARYVRRYVGARELLHGHDRYCLWLVDAPPSDIQESPVLRTRTDKVRTFRMASRAASTRAAASTPHLFRQLAQPDNPYLCIPAHVSESRPYFLASRLGPEAIASNANFLATDTDGFMFAVISSAIFMTWQRTVGGRIKSDLRFNKLLTWNTFPLPMASSKDRNDLNRRGEVSPRGTGNPCR